MSIPRLCLCSNKVIAAVIVLIFSVTALAQGISADEVLVPAAVQADVPVPQNMPPLDVDAGILEANDSDDESEIIDLLTSDLSKHWKIFSSAPESPDSPVWKVVPEGDKKELVLICSGDPKGYLYTTDTCGEFELTLEWKYPLDADGNSGVLVFTQDEPRIWPTSMQVQLHQPKAGSVFPSGDATSDQSSDAEPDLARPVDTWNEGKIVSKGGRLSVEVNGKKAGEVTGAKPSVGSIALQSEGSVVHFRRIRLRKLPATEPVKQAEIPSTVSSP